MSSEGTGSRHVWLGAAGVIAFASSAAGLSALWSKGMREFYASHGVWGWGLVAALIVVVAGLSRFSAYQTKKFKREYVGSWEKATEKRHREATADITVVEERLKPFLTRGPLREKLEFLAVDKYFSRELERALEQVQEALVDGYEPIYDRELREAALATADSLKQYLDELSPYLDAPPGIAAPGMDLRIIQPPGGTWDEDRPWDDFYRHVRSLAPLRAAFLTSLKPVEKRLHDLRVEIGLIQPSGA